MLITKLILKGYKRLMLNNVNYFEYTPVSPYQLILGTNGSGKSSVLNELSPLPAQASDYVKDGFKEIHLSHGPSEYVLISTFKSGNKHQFLKDGAELNPGGTLTVQRELVRREFGLWPDLHALCIGRERFTQMTSAKRREWITALSSADYTYALGVYDRLRSNARDAQGALKHDRMRLGQETQSLNGLGDLSQLEAACIQWREELNVLLLSRPANTRQARLVNDAFTGLCELTERVGTELLRSVPISPSSDYSSLQDVQDHIVRATQETSSVKSLLEHYVNEYRELEEITVALEGDVLDISALETKYTEFQTAIDQRRSALRLFQELSDPESVAMDLQTALPNLISLFTTLPNNVERVFTKERVTQAQEALSQSRKQIDICNNRLVMIDTQLEKMATAKDITCPKCQYIWVPGYSEAEERRLILAKEEYTNQHVQSSSDASQASEYLTQAEEYTYLFNQFRALVQSFPRLQPLWDLILENNYHLDNPKSRVTTFNTFESDVKLHVEINRLKLDAGHLLELIERDRVRQGGSSVHFDERMAKIKESIERTTDRLRVLSTELTSARQFQSQFKQWNDQYTALEKAWTQYPTLYSESIELERCKHIDRVVDKHQSALGIAQQKLVKQTTLQGIVTDLEASAAQLQQNVDAYRVVLRELSPTEGLIADQLNGFIKCVTDQLNSVIASVWAYDMVVLPCSNENGELDYKFPIQMPNTIVADINEGSTAMMEIIDFAFKITVMLYLNMREYPLYLDELGASFDEQHRINVMTFVKRLVDTGYNRQVFLVSHYAGSVGHFTSAETLVMDPRNIATPSVYNTHVTMS